MDVGENSKYVCPIFQPKVERAAVIAFVDLKDPGNTSSKYCPAREL
ncbi:MAG: hypothetical protein WAN10_18985 [Candidatus Acidiferrales bacterium]